MTCPDSQSDTRYCKYRNQSPCPYIQYQHQIKKEGKNQESIQSSTTHDPGYQWESNGPLIRHHKREPRGHPSQQVTTRHQ